MKTDVLDTFDTIKICTKYKINGEETDVLPFDFTEEVEPVYIEMAGWKTDLTRLTNDDQLPSEVMEYIAFIEKETGVAVSVVSVGPDREQTLMRNVLSA